MTLKELSQLYHLNREIEMLIRKLRDMESNISPPPPNLSGMPHGSGSNASKTETEALRLAELKSIIEARKKRLEREKLRLEAYIDTIPDSLTRQIFTYRFINGLPWEQVAANIGGYNTADSVKKCCYRYIKSSGK